MDDILWFPNLSLKICFVKNEGLTIKVMHVEIRHYNANNDITHNISQSDSVWWVSLISVNEDWIEEEEEEDLFIIISSLYIYVKISNKTQTSCASRSLSDWLWHLIEQAKAEA